MGLDRQKKDLTTIAAKTATSGRRRYSSTAEMILLMSKASCKEAAMVVETAIITTRISRTISNIEEMYKYNDSLQSFSDTLNTKINTLSPDQKDQLLREYQFAKNKITELNNPIKELHQLALNLDKRQKTILDELVKSDPANNGARSGIIEKFGQLRSEQQELLQKIERLRSNTQVQAVWQDLESLRVRANNSPLAKTAGAATPAPNTPIDPPPRPPF